MKKGASFAPESDSPATRACVDVLLLVGRAMRLHFPDFVDACDADSDQSSSWDHVLGVLAGMLFREMHDKHITDIRHARDVWEEFAHSPTVKRLTLPCRRALRRVETQIAADAVAGNAGVGAQILWTANQQA